jgi:hypothetical protein
MKQILNDGNISLTHRSLTFEDCEPLFCLFHEEEVLVVAVTIIKDRHGSYTM